MTSPQGTWALLVDSITVGYQKEGKTDVKSCAGVELQNSILYFGFLVNCVMCC